MTIRPLLIGLAIACLTSASSAQLPGRKLGAPTARLEEPFSDIASIRELRDGRVIVLDSKEQRIVIADLASGRITPVGAKGRGPGEFMRATLFLPLPGDTTWIIDSQGGRVLVLGPDGTPTGVVTTFPPPAADSGVSINALRATDGQGRVYFARSTRPPSPENVTPPDSTRILQYDRARGAIAARATVALPESKISVKRSGQQITSIEITRTPFTVGDEWGVGPAGQLVIARRAPYRIEILALGKPPVRGPVVPVNARKVTEADKDEDLASLPNAAARKREDVPWPESMPPFLMRALILTDREAWVRRTRAAGAESTMYDVFDLQGRRVAEMSLPSVVRVILVTARGVYVTRTDDDGLQFVERHALPR